MYVYETWDKKQSFFRNLATYLKAQKVGADQSCTEFARNFAGPPLNIDSGEKLRQTFAACRNEMDAEMFLLSHAAFHGVSSMNARMTAKALMAAVCEVSELNAKPDEKSGASILNGGGVSPSSKPASSSLVSGMFSSAAGGKPRDVKNKLSLPDTYSLDSAIEAKNPDLVQYLNALLEQWKSISDSKETPNLPVQIGNDLFDYLVLRKWALPDGTLVHPSTKETVDVTKITPSPLVIGLLQKITPQETPAKSGITRP